MNVLSVVSKQMWISRFCNYRRWMFYSGVLGRDFDIDYITVFEMLFKYDLGNQSNEHKKLKIIKKNTINISKNSEYGIKITDFFPRFKRKIDIFIHFWDMHVMGNIFNRKRSFKFWNKYSRKEMRSRTSEKNAICKALLNVRWNLAHGIFTPNRVS